MTLGWPLTSLRLGQIWVPLHLHGKNIVKSFSQNVLKTNAETYRIYHIFLDTLIILFFVQIFRKILFSKKTPYPKIKENIKKIPIKMKILRSVTQVDRRFVVPEFLILTIMDIFLLDKYKKLNLCYFLTDHRIIGRTVCHL